MLPVVLHKLHRLCTLHLKTRYHAFKGSYDNGWHCFIKTMLTINLQGSAKGYFISSLVSWQRFDVKHYCVIIYCKRLRFESRFFEGHVLFWKFDSNFKFVICINCFLKHLYKMIKMQFKIDLDNMVNYR